MTGDATVQDHFYHMRNRALLRVRCFLSYKGTTQSAKLDFLLLPYLTFAGRLNWSIGALASPFSKLPFRIKQKLHPSMLLISECSK